MLRRKGMDEEPATRIIAQEDGVSLVTVKHVRACRRIEFYGSHRETRYNEEPSGV